MIDNAWTALKLLCIICIGVMVVCLTIAMIVGTVQGL